MLHCQVQREGKCVATHDALNEVVMNQSAVRALQILTSAEWALRRKLQS